MKVMRVILRELSLLNGKFSRQQRANLRDCLKSLNVSLELYKPGTSIKEVTKHVVYIMVEGLVKLGIMHGDIEHLIETKSLSALLYA